MRLNLLKIHHSTSGSNLLNIIIRESQVSYRVVSSANPWLIDVNGKFFLLIFTLKSVLKIIKMKLILNIFAIIKVKQKKRKTSMELKYPGIRKRDR